jgi:hypothetical protein
MNVLEESRSGRMQKARAYIAPAHIDRHVSDNYFRDLIETVATNVTRYWPAHFINLR